MDIFEKEVKRKARLLNGNIVDYDVCGPIFHDYDLPNHKYIGIGYIHSIDDAAVFEDTVMCFCILKKEKK